MDLNGQYLRLYIVHLSPVSPLCPLLLKIDDFTRIVIDEHRRKALRAAIQS